MQFCNLTLASMQSEVAVIQCEGSRCCEEDTVGTQTYKEAAVTRMHMLRKHMAMGGCGGLEVACCL